MTPARGTWPHRTWKSLLCFVLATLLVSGCAFMGPGLVQTLPQKAAGVDFDLVQVVDDAFMSGHAVDDVLASLGKERSQATAVFRDASTGAGGVGALRVDGVSGEKLLDAVVKTWLNEATVSRTQTTIGDREAWVLETRTGHITIAYRRGDVVYLAFGEDLNLVERFVRGGVRDLPLPLQDA